MNKKIVGVGMSGGVDSSVAAYLLKERGYEVIGITMLLVDDEKSRKAIVDAKNVCEVLGIKHYVIDLKNEFKDIVIKYFINSYKNGVTPNPCVVCNKYFKFGLFYNEAKKIGCDYISTGHYARIEDGRLYRSTVGDKDQSYFMYGIDKNVLKHVILPLEEYKDKSVIRDIAKKFMPNISEKKDSQEVCFVPNDDYKSFLVNNLDSLPDSGNICLEDGTVIGRHKGLMYYTIGQRRGLNISYKEALYVIKFDTINNCLIVGPNSSLFKDELIASDVNWLVDDINTQLYAKVRSRGGLKPVKIESLSDGVIRVKFLEKERAITPGQSIVFYDANDCCLGGGIIKEVL